MGTGYYSSSNPGVDTVDSITDAFCDQTKVVFGDFDDHGEKGGLVWRDLS